MKKFNKIETHKSVSIIKRGTLVIKNPDNYSVEHQFKKEINIMSIKMQYDCGDKGVDFWVLNNSSYVNKKLTIYLDKRLDLSKVQIIIVYYLK